MAIRFPCPACRQPIEIDDEWAGQSVGCPFCQKVVTAPAQTHWSDEDVPVATPAGSAFGQAPPPPPGMPQGRAPGQYGMGVQRSTLAPKALALAVASVVLAIVGYVAFVFAIVEPIMGQLGPNPTEEEIRRAQQEIMDQMMETGQVPRSPVAMFAAVAGVCCGLAGLVLGAKSLVRQESRKGTAIAACIISTFFLCCQTPLMLISCQNPSPPQSPPPSSAPATAPAGDEDDMEADRLVAGALGVMTWKA